MADPRLTVVKMLLKMDSSEAYSNILLDKVFSETDLSDRDKAFAAALFYGVLERRLTLDHIIGTNSKIPFEKLDEAALKELQRVYGKKSAQVMGVQLCYGGEERSAGDESDFRV